MKTISKTKVEIFLLLGFLLFSCWLMNKSFGYDEINHRFRFARHQVGDFGLHISLIRSFSWGNNWPAQSPYFPGRPLPYHYGFDLIVGLLERIGVRLDIAFNGLSVLAFFFLLYFIFKLAQIIFGENFLLGLFAVAFFLCSSSLGFIDFLKDQKLGLNLFRQAWFLPDYLHLGPFDGSLISTFFTLNVFLNQRHLVAALAISLAILVYFLPRLLEGKTIDNRKLILFGLLLGILSLIHALTFFSMTLILFFLLLFFRRFRWLVYLFLPAALISSFHFRLILGQNLNHPWIYFGYLASQPLTFTSLLRFWWLNFGLAVLTIPLGFFLANQQQKKIFLSFFPLFILGNLIQFSFRIDHNHSLFNLFFLMANIYSAFFLNSLWSKKIGGKILTMFLFFFLTVSGFLNLMAIKNDFQLWVDDAPGNQLSAWIKKETAPGAIFLSREEVLDPITFSGRRNYFGNRYYLEVMGYNFSQRENLVKKFFEANNPETLVEMRNEGIDFLVVPLQKIPDFRYQPNLGFLKGNLFISYQDKNVIVFRL